MTAPKRVVASSTNAFSQAAAKASHYELCLFVAGGTPLSVNAVANIVDICNEHLAGNYDLVVIDVYQDPARAKEEQIIAIPTLIKRSPFPLRRLVGDLSNRDVVLRGLAIDTGPDAK